MNELKITHVSHACLTVEGEFGKLLCDPWFLNEPVYSYAQWKFPAAVIPPEKLVKDLTHLYITHTHEDHFHIPSIDYISRDVLVILPEYEHHSSLRAQTMERVMRELGFNNIRKVNSWDSYDLDENTKLTVVPSANSRDHDWENSGFVIDHPSCRMINMNDNISDIELCEDIHKHFDYFDIGFLHMAGVSIFPACYRMSEEEREEKADKNEVNFEEYERLVGILDIKNVVPYAGDFGWYRDIHLDYNKYGRGTPLLIENWLRDNFPDRTTVRMYPSDEWTPSTGLTANHPEIDWDNHMDEVLKVKAKLQKKIDHYEAWLKDYDPNNLEERTRKHVANINEKIFQGFIDFKGRFRMVIEGENSNFHVMMDADPEKGFHMSMDDNDPCDQSLYLDEYLWAAVLDGKIMWNMPQWNMQVEEHVPFRKELGRMWSWIEYYLDLNSKNPQVILDPHFHLWENRNPIDPKFGTVTYDDDWDLPWMKEGSPRTDEAA